MQKILVVEDDSQLNKTLCYAMEKAGYRVTSAFDIAKGKAAYEKQEPDLVLLDVNLPDGEGFSFCKWIKERAETPVIFLTARDLEEDALAGYELGAEDYVTKPFSMKILLKKLELILQRTKHVKKELFDDGNLRMELENGKVWIRGKECSVTPTELRLLKLFVANKGQLLTYDILLERLWDSDGQFVDKHALAVNINRLRGKIEDKDHRYISNVYGMGYQWIG